MRKPPAWAIPLVVTLGLVLSACNLGSSEPTATEATVAALPSATPDACGGDAIGCVDIAPGEPIHLAYMLALSGDLAFLGEDSLGGIEIAVDDAGGTLLGHPILLTGEDSVCSSEGGMAAALNVTADPSILGVIGTNCMSAMSAALDTISGAGLSIISPSITAPGLTLEDLVWKPGTFRAIVNDLAQGMFAAEYAYNELSATTVATIHDGTPYADHLQEVMASRFAELGGTVTFQGAVSLGDTDMSAALTAAAAGSPEVLYLPVFEPEGSLIVAQAADFAGLETTILIGADGLIVDAFPESAGVKAIGMYLTGPNISGPAYDAFLVGWAMKYGGEPPSRAHSFAYDATNLLLEGISQAAVQDLDGTLHIGRQALRDAISNISGFPGLSGTLNCGDESFAGVEVSKGDCATEDALAIYEITAAEVSQGKWPPEVVFP